MAKENGESNANRIAIPIKESGSAELSAPQNDAAPLNSKLGGPTNAQEAHGDVS